jgi:predicted membrane-bound spermidine synthase
VSLLCVAVFLSGTAGVLFETLWFRVAGLTLGNGFWSANIVLASFMAGLAAGNAIAGRHGKRLTRPLRFYALTELTVGVAGILIVVLLPALSPVLGRLFTRLLAHARLVNLLRLVVAFAVLSVPATAMGLTLPILTKVLARDRAGFGRALGRLYGWNTLGGVAGALAGELWLIGWLGQRGTAVAAGILNAAAAMLALSLITSREGGESSAPPDAGDEHSPAPGAWRILSAAFLSGATLLALEVVWFRFLQLFVYGTSFIFAAMLAVVLLGIGVGGLIAGGWLGRDPRGHRVAPLVAVAAAIAVVVTYATFDPRVHGAAYNVTNIGAAFWLFIRLMLPTSVLSGVLFTMLGAAQRQACGEASEAAGKLTLANTLGAVVGALLVGFVLLPGIGIEKTLFVSMLSYGVVALLARTVRPPTRDGSYRRVGQIGAVALYALGAALYPFGQMRNHFVPQVLERYRFGDPELLEMREGLTETVMLLRTSYRGQPLYHRLMTNGHSMSATTYRGRRYMKLYAYWALAVNPGARNALLISYGIGTTAKALTDTRQLESIDVVDVSREILALGPLAFPGASPPLADPRVRVHVEDGRFFLQTTGERFDLITAEPPPPRGAGITNLYSREYFQLVHDRLREGGVATYWLPVNQLWLSETKAIMRGFCDAFPDCTLWSGAGLQWMLAGTRGARGPIPEDRFTAQWHDPAVAPELAALGFEAPESLGATFLADAATMGEWTRDARPLDDDHPGRIGAEVPSDENGDPTYRTWMSPRDLRTRFEASAFIRDLWPPELRRRTLSSFAPQVLFDDLCVWGHFNPLESLRGVLTLSSLRTLPLLLMGTEPAVQKIAVPIYEAGARDADLEFEMGARAMSERDYAGAAEHLASVTMGSRAVQAQLLRTLALGLSGREPEARRCLESVAGAGLSAVDASSVQWLARFLQHGVRRPEAARAGQRPAPVARQ